MGFFLLFSFINIMKDTLNGYEYDLELFLLLFETMPFSTLSPKFKKLNNKLFLLMEETTMWYYSLGLMQQTYSGSEFIMKILVGGLSAHKS